ncbi:hypothetical protein ABZ379_09820 [Streptomyces canus]|uniref:hypothetical protein n=1 Tax=Streptomyces canus TaxID=58343 RepID=UPI0033FF820A
MLATALYAWNLSSVTGNTFYDAAVWSGAGAGRRSSSAPSTAVSDYCGLYRLG